MKIEIKSINEIDKAAQEFIDAIGSDTIFAFNGEMGAGKTTFINALCRQLGVEDDSTGSPTLAIVNEYRTCTGRPIYHFDLYRIDDPTEALDFGVEDYFDSGELCFLEWAERIEPLLPDNVVAVDITVNPDGSRTLSF
ncbi:MAG: tRNA (adenosine(37)-N6)-threonylcarbamoyltransferase complex ATPase subunit type 1 TsaE [Muribaculaceae bacterium]|nr:tRNA (adenosine(37)-N6)-threonylcarbamoyltransferase complex ATPase subunit type 1 TsaE [Muribaculaceae bacterium]